MVQLTTLKDEWLIRYARLRCLFLIHSLRLAIINSHPQSDLRQGENTCSKTVGAPSERTLPLHLKIIVSESCATEIQNFATEGHLFVSLPISHIAIDCT